MLGEVAEDEGLNGKQDTRCLLFGSSTSSCWKGLTSVASRASRASLQSRQRASLHPAHRSGAAVSRTVSGLGRPRLK